MRRRETALSTKPVTVALPITAAPSSARVEASPRPRPGARPPAPGDARGGAGDDGPPAPAGAAPAAPGPASRPSRPSRPARTPRPSPGGRGATPWAIATPWLMAAVLLLAAWLAWSSVDLLHYRLLASSGRFEAAVQHSRRFWTLHHAAEQATQAIDSQLAGGAAPAAADVARFTRSADALRAEILAQGGPMQAQGAAWMDAAARLSAGLAAPGAPARRPLEEAQETAQEASQVRAVLAGLAEVGEEARAHPPMAGAFLGEVEDVRRQLLVAFSLIVGMLVLVVGLAAQWVATARRERASRGRAEHLARLAEAQRVRAEAADREKDRFLGMLSHELLTPLQSLWSTIDVIESRGRVEAGDAAFRRLKDSTRSLRGRISDLLDFAKMSSGRLEMRIRAFQLDKLVDTALRDVEEALAERNLDVHWEAGPELSRRICSDPARLRQIIDNLLTNAIKYTERGGISIVAALIPERGMLRLEISDTGMGIEPAAMARLFEPFYRAPSTAGMAEGSGLGLAVVRRVVDLMGGTIHFESQPGQGTVATLEVPVTDGADGVAVAAPPRAAPPLPVLVVDDAADARRAIADVIRSLGVDVVEAADGAGGLAAAATADFQAIFLDLQMPDLSGLEVARRLREEGGRHRRTFLALISAYNDVEAATLDALFDARIDKPAGRKALMAALARAAARQGP